MSNIMKTDKEIELAHRSFAEDSNIRMYNDQIVRISHYSMPIGMNDNGFIYEDKINDLVNHIKEMRDSYIKTVYGSYFA